jgi:hypothetical protein
MEDRHFLRTGGSKVLAKQRLALLVEFATVRRHDFLDIALRLDGGINAIDGETRHCAIDDEGDMGGGIRGAEVNGMTALGEANGDGGGDRCLPDAALPMTMMRPRRA